MSNLPSKNVLKVFPFSHNRNLGETDAYNDRLFYEEVVANLLRQLMDTQGFVISNEFSTNGVFEFNLGGYYFAINDIPSDLDLATVVYAQLVFKVPADNAPSELMNDNDSTFQGLSFTDSAPESTSDAPYLKILEKNGNEWQIPQESKLKFNSNSINITKIDARHN